MYKRQQPQLEDTERNQMIERLDNLLVPGSKEDGALTANHWGVRQLAYPIKKFQEGYYILYEAQIDPVSYTHLTLPTSDLV